MLAAIGLAACGGSPAPESQQGDPTLLFPAPGTNAPVVEADVTDLGECGAFPGEWKFLDLTTGAPMALDVKPLSTFQNKFQKSWGGTTTAHAVWKVEPGDMPVWNEGRRLHVGSDTPLTTTGMIADIALTGTPGSMTALIGTDRGLVIADLKRNGDHWILQQQVTIDAVGAVRSVATTNLILEKDGPYVPMVFIVANDAVLVAKMEDLRANFGCLSVAYRTQDHPGVFHPVKIVTSNDYAAFLTATRLPEEFSSAAQFQLALNKEWLSFQSTAFLIDLTRQSPVAPIITTMGTFDRFFASDISMSNIGVFLYGSRYNSANPAAFKSGIASYKNLQAVTPVVSLWSEVKGGLPGDYRMGRMETHITTATIRSLDRLVQVEGFLSGETQQKWTAWPDTLPLEYVRSVSYRQMIDIANKNKPVQVLVTAPQYLPTGPTSYIWEYKDESKDVKEDCKKNPQIACIPETLAYTASPAILDATPTDVSYHDVSHKRVVFQHLLGEGSAIFPTISTNDLTDPHSPRLFHVGGLIFLVQHDNSGPYVFVFDDTITGQINLSDSNKSIAVIGFRASISGMPTKGSAFANKAIAIFENVSNEDFQSRIDDIQEIDNPLLPQFRHFAMLVHSWNGSVNVYRVVVIQMDLAPTESKQRTVEIQGCSDLSGGGNNFSNNVSFGSPDSHPRFIGPLQSSINKDGTTNYSGYFQHFGSTYNAWRLSINVTAKDVASLKSKSNCETAGELVPLTDPAVSESLSAVLSGNTLLGLHGNGLVKWKIDATTTQFLDVGANILGAPVTFESGQLLGLAGMLFARMDTPDGFHPVALFSQDGSFGESCPDCQFTDAFTADPLLLTSHPERGVELYDFSK